jgi:hypothetical protein
MGDPMEDDGSIGALFARLIGDAKQFVRAELRVYRAQLSIRLGGARTVLILGVVALLLAQSALIGLILGLLLILSGPLGPAGATAVVVGVSLALAGLLVRIAITKVRGIVNGGGAA